MSKTLNIEAIVEKLKERNINGEYNSLADFPHYSLLVDMDKATKRIVKGIRNNEKLWICGDYDADGQVSTALLVEFFRDIGYPVEYIIPDRFKDGYGVSPSVLNKIDHADLIITCDNGVVAFQAALECKRRGIDLIITDHHTVGDKLPDCYAVINPQRDDCNYPTKNICGAQVAYLTCASIKHALGADINMSKYLDILATAVVCDVMVLKGINRHIVRAGLRVANSRKRPFFNALLDSIGKKEFDFDDFGFRIGPMLNATGRIGSAEVGVEALLCTQDKAASSIEHLNDINTQRKLIQLDVYDSAKVQVPGQEGFVLVLGEELHEGIVGIVASRIAEESGYPTLVLSEGKNGILKGSGRSVGSVNIYELINQSKDLLLKFGGHPGACGLSLHKDNFEQLNKELKANALKLPKESFVAANAVLGELEPDEVSIELVEVLNDFAPFGEGNPKPLFYCPEAEIIESAAMGAEKNHTSLTVLWSGIELRMAVFNTDASEYSIGEKISFNFSPSINEWRGKRSSQIMPQNIKKIV